MATPLLASSRRAERKREHDEMQRETDLLILRDQLKPGDTIYTVLRGTPSRSGMQRRIDLVVIKDNKPWQISSLAARLMGRKVHKDGGIVIGGCGMDMGFALVYELSRIVFKDEFYCLGEDSQVRCPSNDHSNERMSTEGTNYSIERLHSDAGYALNHKWL